MVRRRHIAALAALCALAAGCDRRDDLDGRRRSLLDSPAETPAKVASDPQAPVALSLIDNRAAVMVTSGGRLTVWADGARLVPFIDGNLRSEWLLSVSEDGEKAARIRGRISNLFVPLDAGPGGVLAIDRESLPLSFRLRTRSAKQVASVFVNEVRVGDIRVPAEQWVTRTVQVPREHLRPGENRIRLFFRHLDKLPDGLSTPGSLAWVTVGGTAPVPRPEVGGSPSARPRRLRWSVASEARLSSYLQIPLRSPRLLGTVQGQGKAEVRLALPSGRIRSLWSGQASPNGTQFAVDLVELAGKTVRIDLQGPANTAWIEPAITAVDPEPGAGVTVDRVDHIIVWSISSLRADRIGDKTDALARLRRTSLSFDAAWSPAPAPALAHSAVMTGRVQGRGIGQDVDTLATVLSQAGYATALLSGNGFVNDERGFARGFDVYDNPMRVRRPHSARVLWQLARRFLIKRKQSKTFLYIATSEPHLPYTPSDQSLKLEWGNRLAPLPPAKTAGLADATAAGVARLTGEQKSFIRALYDAEVRDADRGLATAVADLRTLGLADSTALVVFGDHGEELFDDGVRFGHGGTVSEAALRVPLMIYVPGGQPGRRAVTAKLADLFPTILELAGVDPPASAGRSLLGPELDERPLSFRTDRGMWALRHAGFKLTASPDKGAVVVERVGSQRPATEVPVATRYLRNALAFAIAFDDVWLEARWGDVANHGPAFAQDQGL